MLNACGTGASPGNDKGIIECMMPVCNGTCGGCGTVIGIEFELTADGTGTGTSSRTLLFCPMSSGFAFLL